MGLLEEFCSSFEESQSFISILSSQIRGGVYKKIHLIKINKAFLCEETESIFITVLYTNQIWQRDSYSSVTFKRHWLVCRSADCTQFQGLCLLPYGLMAILGNLVPCAVALCLKYLQYLLATSSDRCLEISLNSVKTHAGIKQWQSSPGKRNQITVCKGSCRMACWVRNSLQGDVAGLAFLRAAEELGWDYGYQNQLHSLAPWAAQESMMYFARGRRSGLGRNEELIQGKLWGFPQVERWVPKETPPRDCVTNLLGHTWHMQSDVFTASLEHVASNCSCCPRTAGAEMSRHFPKLFFWQAQFPDPFWEKASQIEEAACLPLPRQKDSREGEISKASCQRERRERGNYFQSVFLQMQGEALAAPLLWSCTLPDSGQLLKLCRLTHEQKIILSLL